MSHCSQLECGLAWCRGANSGTGVKWCLSFLGGVISVCIQRRDEMCHNAYGVKQRVIACLYS